MVSRRRRKPEEVRKKLVIVGDGAAGKSSLLFRFKSDHYAGIYVPTVFETYVQDIYIGEQKVELELWDTAGQEDYDRLRPLSYPDTDVLMLCYSIDDPNSLTNIMEKWSPEVDHYCPTVPVVLVGCKCDLRYDQTAIDDLKGRNQSFVPYETGLSVSDRIRAAHFCETSALTREGVREAFESATKIALQPVQKRKHKFCAVL